MSKQATERPWTSVDSALKKLRDNDRGQPRQDFVILGAGIAGLVAAYELTQLGHTVTIYEGDDRIGGRIWTKRFNNGSFHERGAMRIPQAHDYTYHYIKKVAKLDLVQFASSSKEGFYYIRGKVSRTEEVDFNKKILPEFENLTANEMEILKKPWGNGGGPGGLLNHYMDPMYKRLEEAGKTHIEDLLAGNFTNNEFLKSLDRTSWLQYLERSSASKDAIELLGAVLAIRAPWKWSLAAIFKDEYNQGTTAADRRMCAVKEGFDKLSEKIADLLPAGTVQLKSQVISIDVNTRKLKMQDGKEVDFRRKKLLCTIPFSVLRYLPLSGFSREKRDAIRGLGSDYASMGKIMFSYNDSRFWEKQGILSSGRSVSEDDILRSFYPFPAGRAPGCARTEDSKASTPNSGMFSFYVGDSSEVIAAREATMATMEASAKSASSVLIASYTNSEPSQKFCKMLPGEPTKVALEQLKRFHPDMTEPDEVDEWCWDQNPFFKGGMAITTPNTMTNHFAIAKRAERFIHFAGEHVSIAPGWIQGSLESALREAAEMVRFDLDEEAAE